MPCCHQHCANQQHYGVKPPASQLASSPTTDSARRLSPRLQAVREEVVEGNYALALEFSSKKKEMTQQMWDDRREKFQTFFGPGVSASITDTEQVGLCAVRPDQRVG